MALNYISKQEAEKLSGLKLDGRRRYFLWDGDVCVKAEWTQACSGCSDDSEYSTASRGAGCSECGYHGVVRSSCPVPVKYTQRIKDGE